jgi:dTMP kinase
VTAGGNDSSITGRAAGTVTSSLGGAPLASRLRGRALLVSVDGPGGVGKSTLVRLVGRLLADHGVPVHATTQPSPTPLGTLIRTGADQYAGMALACLVAGDRHHQLASEIRPRLAAGDTVLCDRYFPSSLVLQRLDGLDVDTVARLNTGVDRPDLAVILAADPTLIADRMRRRGGHSRFERLPDAAHAESILYRDAVIWLQAAGWPVLEVDCGTTPVEQTATMLADHISRLHADRKGP